MKVLRASFPKTFCAALYCMSFVDTVMIICALLHRAASFTLGERHSEQLQNYFLSTVFSLCVRCTWSGMSYIMYLDCGNDSDWMKGRPPSLILLSVVQSISTYILKYMFAINVL